MLKSKLNILLISLLLSCPEQALSQAQTEKNGAQTATEDSATGLRGQVQSILKIIAKAEETSNNGTRFSGMEDVLAARNGAKEELEAAIRDSEHKLSALGPRAIPYLLDYTNDKHQQVSNTCCKVLTKFGKETVQPLIKLLAETSTPNTFGVRYYNNHRFVQILQGIGPDAYAELTKALNSKSVEDRAIAAQILAEISQYYQPTNEESPVIPLSTVEDLCKACLNDESNRVRENCALALGKVGPRNSAVGETLCRALKQDSDAKVRRKCATSLGLVAARLSEQPAQEIAKTLSNALANDEFEGVRISAATALGQIKTAGDVTVPALTKALKDPILEVKNQALIALCNFGTKAAAAVPDVLRELSEQTTPREAQSAVRLLARIGPPAAAAVPLLVKMAENIRPDEQYLQSTFAQAFAAIGPKSLPAVPLLIEMLNSSDYNVKREAIHAIGAIGPSAHAAENALKELAERDANLKQEAIQALLLIKKGAHTNLIET